MSTPNEAMMPTMRSLPSMAPPAGSPITDQFWAFVADGEFRLPKCDGCDNWRWYPLPLCERCGTPDFEWVLAPTTGKLFSYSIVHHNFLPPSGSVTLPYLVGLVELDDAVGMRFVADIVAPEGQTPRVDDPVHLVMTIVDGRNLPVFAITSGGS